MAVTLTVRQVRDTLYWSDNAAERNQGNPSTAELGRWFHDGLNYLVGRAGAESPLESLRDVAPDLQTWRATLADTVYARFVGPRLTQHSAVLQGYPTDVRHFWVAMKAASDWLAELCWNLNSGHAGRRGNFKAPWRSLADFVQTNEELVCELRDPGWTDSVRLVGIADALIRPSDSDAWCVLEFKSGQGAPRADLSQVCLYHMILTELEKSNQDVALHKGGRPGTLALLSFRPEKHELLFHSEELTAAQDRLRDVIGQLAGVRGSNAVEVGSDRSPATTIAPAQGTGIFPDIRSGFRDDEKHLELGKRIVRELAGYGVCITLEHPVIAGPTFLRYHVILGPGTQVSSIERRGADLQVRLGLTQEPFIFIDEGRLVIDIQRPDRQVISFRDVRDQLPASDPQLGSSTIPVGVNLSGKLICADLSKSDHSHILVAGTTGSGKSEWLRTAIAGLLVSNTPQTLRLVIIDPKRNAFHALRGSPYLWEPIVFPDEQPAYEVLERLCEEMDRRYQLFEGADTIRQVITRTSRPIPRIVCVCDEYRDLISRGKEERKLIESQICRLGAKARAAGIHLILATQEPSRETIKGPLDSNMPTRIGLRLGRDIESRMLLGESGAEKLLGNGDLLFKVTNAPRRLQAPYLPEAERNQIFGSK